MIKQKTLRNIYNIDNFDFIYVLFRRSSNCATCKQLTPLAKFSAIKAKVFVNCTGAQCHSSAGNQGNLVLESNVAFGNLVGVQSALFPQFKRVEAKNSANSLLIKILER